MHPSLLLSVIVGDFLFILGFLAFFFGGSEHLAALIPALFGAIIQTLALVAHFFPKTRGPLAKVILIVAFVGLVIGGARPTVLLLGSGEVSWTLALTSQTGLALGCAVVFCASLVLLLGQAFQRS